MSKYLKAAPVKAGVIRIRVKAGETMPESSQKLSFHDKQAIVRVSKSRPELTVAQVMDRKQIAARSAE